MVGGGVPCLNAQRSRPLTLHARVWAALAIVKHQEPLRMCSNGSVADERARRKDKERRKSMPVRCLCGANTLLLQIAHLATAHECMR